MKDQRHVDVNLPVLCDHHQVRIINASGFNEDDPWQSLLVMSNIVLFRSIIEDDMFMDWCKGEIKAVEHLGCLACHSPSITREIIEKASSGDINIVASIMDRYDEKPE